MTAQVGEIIIVDGTRLSMTSEPLAYYLSTIGKEELFAWTMSSCLRGYFGTWEIEEDRLYLISLEGTLRSGGVANLQVLFPNAERVFADWFSGVIRCPRGKILHYFHLSYFSKYEEDLFLEIEMGMLTRRWVTDNRE
jgi:hypothetical protein